MGNISYQMSIGVQLAVGVKELPAITRVKNQIFVKPLGGFWTSTYLSKGKFASEWVEWCHSEEPEWIKNKEEEKPAVLLEVSPSARIYTIDSVSQLKWLQDKYPHPEHEKWGWGNFALLDWERIAQDYDGVHLTSRGQWATRHGSPNLYGWDCESTIWFRNVFSKVTRYQGKLVR